MARPKSDPLLDVATSALKELGKRLKENPEDMPAHVLSKVAADTMRVLDRREKIEEEVQSEAFDLFHELETLPPDRALILLAEEKTRLYMDIAKVNRAMKELRNAGQEIPEHQEASSVRGTESGREVESVSSGDLQRTET